MESVDVDHTKENTSEPCFHCGLPLPDKVEYTVFINGEKRNMCCAGCSAIAQAILDANLADYYEERTAFATPNIVSEDIVKKLASYDEPISQRKFVTHNANLSDTVLILQNIRCAACVWLIERRLKTIPGVEEIAVNYVSKRMRLKWMNNVIKLSAIVMDIEKIGYHAIPFEHTQAEEMRNKERRTALKKVAIAGLCMMQVMMFSIPTYLSPPGEIAEDQLTLMNWASLLLTIPVLIYSGWDFLEGAWRSTANLHLNMDVPITIGIGIAFIASVYHTVIGSGHVYYDSITMFIFLLLAVRFFEQSAYAKTYDYLYHLYDLLPKYAYQLNEYPQSQKATLVAIDNLQVNDYLLVETGASIPADGVIVEGSGDNDESLITGESKPIPKNISDSVIAGAINLNNPLIIRATAIGKSNTLGKLTQLIEQAISKKPSIAKLADIAASYFTLGLLVVTALIAFRWYFYSPNELLNTVISVLIITCPCALGIAVPAVLTTTARHAFKMGTIVTRSESIEVLPTVTDFIFDKTGTLTQGTLCLEKLELINHIDHDYVISIAASLESGNTHPIAKALCKLTNTREKVENIVYKPGYGIEATINGEIYRIGTLQFVEELNDSSGFPNKNDDIYTVIALGNTKGILATFYFTDALRTESIQTINLLKSVGKNIHIVSGDHRGAVEHIAHQIGISNFHYSKTPDQKLNYIKALQDNGAIVAMIGDGINDAPCMNLSNLSIAMGSSTDLTQSSADIILLSNNLLSIPLLSKVTIKAKRIIYQNFVWAIAYNIIAIPLAGLGLVTPLVAAIGMSVSSAVVITNSLRVGFFNSVDRSLQSSQSQRKSTSKQFALID